MGSPSFSLWVWRRIFAYIFAPEMGANRGNVDYQWVTTNKKLPDTLHSEPGVNLNRTMNKMKKTIS